jgi:DNA-binding response OmpR family regulator
MTTASARPLEGKRILVLEDDYYLATDEKAFLQKAGATVVGPLGSGYNRSDLPQVGGVDAALVDINLGTGPSFDAARVLSDRAIPFLFVTGYDAGIVPEELSHVQRIEKPIRERHVIAALAALLAEDVDHS